MDLSNSEIEKLVELFDALDELRVDFHREKSPEEAAAFSKKSYWMLVEKIELLENILDSHSANWSEKYE